MTTFTQRLDRFVRWFFNSSPTSNEIVPTVSPQRPGLTTVDRPVWLSRSAFGGAALGALILLAVFYSVVVGAVERGASRHADATEHARASPQLVAPMHKLTVARAGD